MTKRWTVKKIEWLSAKIKNNWEKLTDEEIVYHYERPDLFYDAVKKKYGMFKDDAQRQMKKLESGYRFFHW